MNGQELEPLNEAEALALVAAAFEPLKAGGRVNELQALVFRVVDTDGDGVVAPHVIPEHTWRDRTELRDLLSGLREMVQTHAGRTLNPW